MPWHSGWSEKSCVLSVLSYLYMGFRELSYPTGLALDFSKVKLVQVPLPAALSISLGPKLPFQLETYGPELLK